MHIPCLQWIVDADVDLDPRVHVFRISSVEVLLTDAASLKALWNPASEGL